MLIMCLAIAIIAAIVFGVLAYHLESEGCFVGAVISVIVAIGLVIACLCIWPQVATENRIDQKIEMYTEENERIEAEIDLIVKQYMEYEQKTFEEIDIDPGTDTMVLVSLFPELKSDTLVQKQIELHTSNANKIKCLKAEKIDLGLLKWLLYFGG